MHQVFLVAGAVGLLSLLTTSSGVQAQIIPDNTLPTNSALPSGCLTCLIEGGTAQGNNLFHSFLEFSVPTGGQAIFNNGSDVFNIFSRVTGTSVSSIDGLLGANGIANLYFINPNGILFGPNARLDVGGSFLASTATALTFPDGSEFSSVAPQAPPLLGWNVPVGLQYGPGPTGNITSTGQLSAGQDLVLAAGSDLRIEGQLLSGRNMVLSARDTLAVRDLNQPFIAAAGGTLIVEGLQDVDIFALNFRDSGFFSGDDMTLRSSEVVGGDAHYWAGGNFRVENFNGQLASLYSPYDPVIRAIGNVEFVNYEGGSLHILAGGSVTITGNVIINSVASPGEGLRELNPISLLDITPIALQPYLENVLIEIDGEARPTLDIRAGMRSILTDQTQPNPLPLAPPLPGFYPSLPVFSPPALGSDITVNGNVDINIASANAPGLIFLTNLYGANSSTQQPGNITTGRLRAQSGTAGVDSGSIYITSSGNFLFNANMPTDTVGSNTDGVNLTQANAGDIFIVAGGSINTTSAAAVDAGAALGNAGDIFLYAVGDVFTSRVSSWVIADDDPSIASDTIGQGGDITIFSLNGNIDTTAGQLVSGASFTERTGNILLTALNGNLSVGEVQGESQFAGGSIEFSSPNGTLIFDGDEILSSISQNGNGSNIIINAANLILQNGAKFSAITLAEGQGGSVIINAGDIQIRDNSAISVSGRGLGPAGSISINSTNMQMERGARIEASSNAGDGGNININLADSLILRFDSDIRAVSLGDGDGGNIAFNVGNYIIGVLSEDSDVIATSASGRGGRISSNVRPINFRFEVGRETPESDFWVGEGGELIINVDENAFPELPSEILDASNWFSTACPAGGTPTTRPARSVADNRFTVLGRSGLPSTPESPFADEAGNVNPIGSTPTLGEQSGGADIDSDIDSRPIQIVEANSWLVDEQGHTVLRASAQAQGNTELQSSQRECL